MIFPYNQVSIDVLASKSHDHFFYQILKFHVISFLFIFQSHNQRNYLEEYTQSLKDPEGYWGEAAKKLTWHKPWNKVLDNSNPPFTKWYVIR